MVLRNVQHLGTCPKLRCNLDPCLKWEIFSSSQKFCERTLLVPTTFVTPSCGAEIWDLPVHGGRREKTATMCTTNRMRRRSNTSARNGLVSRFLLKTAPPSGIMVSLPISSMRWLLVMISRTSHRNQSWTNLPSPIWYKPQRRAMYHPTYYPRCQTPADSCGYR